MECVANHISWNLRGHEDIDQVLSQQAAVLSRTEFSTPEEVVAMIDSTFRPQSAAAALREKSKPSKVEIAAYKLEEVADWRAWVKALGVRLVGLRNSVFRIQDHIFVFYFLFL